MQARNYFGLGFLPLLFAFCPSAFGVSYSWNFASSGLQANATCIPSGRNSCAGNSMTFSSNGVTATATAWYFGGSGTLQSATLNQYSSGLGVCNPTESCTGFGSASNQEVDDNGNDEFILFTFTKPINPTSITIKSPTGGGLGVSYWLGSAANQPTSLTGSDVAALSNLGFGSQTDAKGGIGGTVNFGGPPTTSVNAILFGARYGYNGDNFDIIGLTGTPVGGSLPEPTSIFLLFTAALAAFGLSRRTHRPHP